MCGLLELGQKQVKTYFYQPVYNQNLEMNLRETTG